MAGDKTPFNERILSVFPALRNLASQRKTWLWLVKGPVVLCLLWVLSFQVFVNQPPFKKGGKFRVDRKEAVAYPMSDAGCDFQNALAILSGDGWVNWRHTNRWSVYKPGWAAVLAGLCVVYDRDLAKVQNAVTSAMACTGPLFYLLVLALFPGRRSPAIAALASVLFVLYPSGDSWWFQRTMMTEGPTLLLSILVCLLAVRFCSRPRWRWKEGFALGLACASVGLIRSQSRFAVAGMVLVLLLASLRKPRIRLPFLILFFCGFAAVAGPVYLKTSYHLGTVYDGTSYLDVEAVLSWSQAGKNAGGAAMDMHEVWRDEAAAIKTLKQRAMRAVRANWNYPEPKLKEGLGRYRNFIFANLAQVFRTKPWHPPFFRSALVLCVAGLGFSWFRRGWIAWVPVAYSLCYMAPLFAFSYYWPRFGAPISFVGILFAAGGLLVLLEPREAARAWRRARALARVLRAKARGAYGFLRRPGRAFRSRTSAKPLSRGALRGGGWPPWPVFPLLFVWIVGAGILLIRVDLSPLPTVDTAKLLADGRVQETLARAGISTDSQLGRELDAAVNRGVKSQRVVTGIAHHPWVVEPGDPVFSNPWSTLKPFSRTYTGFFLVSPWKADDQYDMYLVTVPGTLYGGFRHGDRVVAFVGESKPTPQAATVFGSLIPTVHSSAVIPVRWGGR